MANIRDVAQRASVSVATVSRTLQHPDRVAAKSREKVLNAIAELGYKPNLMAVKFRSGKTQNLVVLVPAVSNVFFARVISGMQQEAAEHGYAILLANTTGNKDIEQHYAKMVSTSQADGLIQLRAHNPFEANAANDYGLFPMVNACEVMDSSAFPTVALDNRAAAKAMTQHLLSLGHRRIAMIKGPKASPLTRERLAGYREALHEAGLDVDETLLFPGDFTLASGYQAGEQILACAPRPTAVFCENDEMAMGAMHAFKSQQLRIPHDISVAGFDDIAFSQYCDPPLTTIAQPAEEFGRTAVTLLLDVLNSRIRKAPRVIMPYDVVVRGSTGPVPAVSR